MKPTFLNPNDLRTYPVQQKACKTCPFEGNGLHLSPERYAVYLENLITFQGQHFCHSLDDKAICRGGRNIQLRVLCAKGLLPEPTDAAFDAAINAALEKKLN